MATVINGVKTAVLLAAATPFTVTGPAVVVADGLAVGEEVMVYRLGPSTAYHPYTNENGVVTLSAYPNMVVLPAQGTYKVTKGVTAGNVHVSYDLVTAGV